MFRQCVCVLTDELVFTDYPDRCESSSMYFNMHHVVGKTADRELQWVNL